MAETSNFTLHVPREFFKGHQNFPELTHVPEYSIHSSNPVGHASLSFDQLVACVLGLRCWPAEWRCAAKRPWKPSRHEGGNLEHNNTNNNEFWDSFTTGSELGDIIFSVLLALEKSSFDRLYLFGRPAKDMEGYFMANHSQRLGKIVTTYYASVFINQLVEEHYLLRVFQARPGRSKVWTGVYVG